jgi:hypothetical protein
VFRNRLRDFNPNPMSRPFAPTMTGALFCRFAASVLSGVSRRKRPFIVTQAVTEE